MRPVATSFLPLLLALAPAAAPAQEGPSFNCNYASTRTEVAICGSPELAALERRMVGAYEQLVGAIGRRQARAIADELLVRRQACEGDPNCIAERLLISEEVFRQRAGGDSRAASAEPVAPRSEAPALAEEIPAEPPRVAAAEPSAPDLPLAAQAPWPLESAPIPPVRPDDTQLASAEDLSAAIEGAELASSDGDLASIDPDPAADPNGPASFDTPLSWAWMALSRERRAAIQANLAAAGVYGGPAEGAWTNATQAALEEVLASPRGEGFDVTTQQGATLALDFLRSGAFGPGTPPEEAASANAVDLPDW